jgi:microcystin-dependent protein
MPIQISNDVKVGTVVISGESSIEGYLLCNGSLISRTVYNLLFSVIGTTFGSGNGSTTFAIPDLVGAVPRGAGTSSSYTQNVTVTLGTKDNDRMQGHHHDFRFYHGSAFYGAGGYHDNVSSTNSTQVLGPLNDGTNGIPRTANETKMKNVGVNFFIKF